jgi:hypothetical protein
MNDLSSVATLVARQRLLVQEESIDSLTVFDRAAGLLPSLVRTLGLGALVAPLALDHKPRVLYRFRVPSTSRVSHLGQEVVLKVYGDAPRGEGPVLRRWKNLGLTTPNLIWGETDGCSWLVLEHLNLRPVRDVDVVALTDYLAGAGRLMHRRMSGHERLLRGLADVMNVRWNSAAAALGTAGYNLPSEWTQRANDAYACEETSPLHGDLALDNLGWTKGNLVVILDASALIGHPALDAARWAARTGPEGAGPASLLRRWLSSEGLSLDRTSWSLLAAECVLEAGSREIARARRKRMGIREDPGPTRGVRELIRVASVLWA